MLKNAIWLFGATILVLVIFLPSYSRMQDLRQKNKDYAEQVAALKSKNQRLRKEKKLLENDPVYLEKVGREKMGLVREGEVIYKITPVTGNREKK